MTLRTVFSLAAPAFRREGRGPTPSILCGLSLATIAAPGAAQGNGYAPRFEEAACPFEASAGVLEQLRCGWLVVPQNRASPQDRQLRLAVAVMKSTRPAPRPDPIVFLSGGPGGKSVENVPARTTSPVWNRLRAERDVVFFDQRGTGYSEPEFCPEITDESFRSLFLGRGPAGVASTSRASRWSVCCSWRPSSRWASDSSKRPAPSRSQAASLVPRAVGRHPRTTLGAIQSGIQQRCVRDCIQTSSLL
jgi:hypothetical protein